MELTTKHYINTLKWLVQNYNSPLEQLYFLEDAEVKMLLNNFCTNPVKHNNFVVFHEKFQEFVPKNARN